MSSPTTRTKASFLDVAGANGDGAAVTITQAACAAAERPVGAAGVGAGLPENGLFDTHFSLVRLSDRSEYYGKNVVFLLFWSFVQRYR